MADSSVGDDPYGLGNKKAWHPNKKMSGLDLRFFLYIIMMERNLKRYRQ